MWLEVSVPVLSEKMCETWPSSSRSDIWRTWHGSSCDASYISISLATKTRQSVWKNIIET